MTRLFTAAPFVIAEVGSNFRTFDDAMKSIEIAAACGANAAKFQAFDWPALYGTKQMLATIDGINLNYKKMRHQLPLDWLPNLKSQADAHDIELMCTAFSPELVAVVDPYVEVHKIASSDACWPQMLEAVAKTGKPVLISFGGKSDDERRQAMDLLQGKCLNGRDDVVPLYCVAAYPADCAVLPDFHNDTTYDGFSDHTLGYTAAVESARMGAIVIEKHFTAFPDLDTPDRLHSLTPAQFTRMVQLIRGEPVVSEETAMHLRHNRRLIATRDITADEVMTYGVNFGAYRSLVDDTRGLSPFDWERVEGKRATKTITRGMAIGEGDFK